MEQCCRNVAFPEAAEVKDPNSVRRPTPVWGNRDRVTEYVVDNVREDLVPFPIAIVGMGMRLPGGVSSGTEFWNFLVNKRDGLCRVPETRYNVDAFYDEAREGAVWTKHGYFLEQDIAQLDIGFFGISKPEAEKLDPQQRLLLEVVWECMENAGQTNWQGTNIGCFVGVFGEDWLDLLSKDTQQHDRYRVMSAGDFALSNRVSYEYDLTGPSVTVRTGCSSSMVGLHEACQAIYTGECSSAIVAGTNLIMSPTMTTTMSENLVLSSSGLCRTFDAAADGYGRGEAINAVFVKPLADALANADPIRAIIRSTAVNCDGKTPSITTPDPKAQERLIRRAYKKAHIEGDDILKTAFFECHGTGTIAGDTAETTGVANIFGEKGIYIGAVKPNVGHSEGASGITSIIKCVLALEKNIVPPNVHFHTPNPKIPFEDAKLQVPVEPTPWPSDRKERISVNSFGIGGTNAHVILDSASSVLRKTSPEARLASEPDYHLLVLSAKEKRSLDGQIERITRYIEASPSCLNDLAFTLARRRYHLPYRAFAVADKDGSLPTFQKAQSTAPCPVFVFTGQGAQWPTMGMELMCRFPKFREDIHRMDKILTELREAPPWSIEEELSKDEAISRVGHAEFAQPLCTAIQIALVNLLREWGIVPSAVVGHSSGEIAAAYASGAISDRVAIILSYLRGQAIKALSMSRSGAMAAVGISPDTAHAFLEEGVTIACENSPISVTLSGDKEALDRVLDRIHNADGNVVCRRLAVDIAYHSHHMLRSRHIYESLISPHICHNSSMLPLYSSVTSTPIIEPTKLDAAYWSHNLSSTVLFRTAVQGILDDNGLAQLFLEIGPHSTLAGPLRQIFQAQPNKAKSPLYVPTLRRGTGEWQSLLVTGGQMFMYGIPVDLGAIITNGVALSDLPPYSWKHGERYWNESRLASHWRLRHEPHHELLGSRVLESSSVEPSWRNVLQIYQVPWLGDHRIGRDVVFPCAGYVAMVGEAIRQITESDEYSVKNMFMRAALTLEASIATEIITTLRPARLADNIDSVWYDFTISAYQNGTWKKHCIGQVRPASDKTFKAKEIIPYPRLVRSEKWYNALEKRGLEYGPQFRGLEHISASPSSYQAAATLQDEDCLYTSHYVLHPIIIDESLQLLSVAATHGIPRQMTRLAIPTAIEELYIGSGRGKMSLDVSCDTSGGMMRGNALLVTDGQVILNLYHGLFFSIQEPDIGNPKPPIAATLHWGPHIDFFPVEKLFSPSESPSGGLCKTFRLVSLYGVEYYHRMRYSQPTQEHLRKWQSWVSSNYEYMRANAPMLVPELRDICSLSPADRAAEFETFKFMQPRDLGYPFYLLCKRILDSLHKLLEGQLEPIDLLVEDGVLNSFYEQSARIGSWHEFASLLGHSYPQLRVLEVGGGTGGDTLVALQGLTLDHSNRLYSTYTFTDISPGFLLEAKEKYKSYPGMEYATLDISRDPVEQGFEPESYDLIIAANVIHATPRISDALRNIRTLLVPGGRLLLIELTCTIPIIDYVMGILPGWWLGDGDGREERPYIPVEEWHDKLLDAGFTGVETFRYDDEPPYHMNARILSRVPPTKFPRKGEVSLLYHTVINDWGRDLAEALVEAGYSVHWCTLKQMPSPHSNIISVIDLEGPFFHELTPADFESFQSYVSHLIDGHLLWVTRSVQPECDDPRYALVLGLARTIRHEIMLHFATVEIDQVERSALQPVVHVFERLLSQLDDPGASPEYEFAVREGSIQVPRFRWNSFEGQVEASEIQAPRVLDIESYAMLDSLIWTCADITPNDLQKEEIEIDIKYVGLNFRVRPDDRDGLHGGCGPCRLEASGIVRRVGSAVSRFSPGDKIMVSQSGLMSTRKVVRVERCIPIPDNVSLEGAATILCVYATVVYSLINFGGLKPGQSVLIHSACGGVGLGAVQLCQLMGAVIYATVGSEEKARHLIDNFNIPADHIFDSRSSSFLQGVLQKTEGRGVDLVLNSLSGDLLHASWQCVAKFGKMLELGKRDFLGHGLLEMDRFLDNRSFVGIDLLQVLDGDIEVLHEMIGSVMEYFHQGKAGPISPVTVFDAADVAKAFRYMQSGQHMGKIVVKMPDDPSTLPVARVHERVSYFPAHASYLLVGGFGGLGRAVATWMVEKGARHLVFLSRTAGNTIDGSSFVKTLECQGCDAITVVGNVGNIDDVRRAVSAAKTPLAGVLQLSMVLKDQSFHNMVHEEWVAALYPKVKGTWNLHHVLKDKPLDFFLLLSSMAGIMGWPGQANYGAANTFLDAFVKYRQSLNLPAHVIDLGLMGDIGYASEASLISALQASQSKSLQVLDERQFLQAVEVAVLAQRLSRQNQVVVGLGTTRTLSSAEFASAWTKEARFDIWKNIIATMEQPVEGSRADELREHMEAIKNNPSLLDRPETEEKILLELGKLVASYTSRPEDMTLEEFSNIPIDSLMTVEIRTWFRRHAGIDITLVEVSNSGTVGGLGKIAVQKLRDKHMHKGHKGSGGQDGDSNGAEEEPRFHDDLTLGKTMRPISNASPYWTSESEGNVFFTGATGFLGAFLLSELLSLPQVKQIACLVRASTSDLGHLRIRQTFSKYGLPVDFRSKIIAIPGDVTKKNLGLRPETFSHLAQWSSVIFHFTGYANYTLPYSVHRGPNVLGLLEILRFANTERLKPVHYCSSISACGITENLTGPVPEDVRPRVEAHNVTQSIGYTQSKFVAESIVWDAIENGFPIAIYRPTIVTGDSRTGACKKQDMVNRFMANCIRLGCYPNPPQQRFHFIPVDFACSAISRISLNSTSLGHAFNITQPDQDKVITVGEVYKILSNYSPTPLISIPTAQFFKRFTKEPNSQTEVTSYILAERLPAHQIWWDDWEYMAAYGTENLCQAIADHPDIIELRPVPELLKVYYDFWSTLG
ncbi:putative polyketide synthase [Aspergillus nomiae NRRL 13137]|uniref:Putative polyketide synthase n=1 Tax=Aspergillus nomiae NRRL (strain ATCC 15546 / NRRL 13137 / CBS 260.88 / M93) TaxID=1509407 RepID=A0A0L1JFT4_ASPN3|nr:putative polyketide synthase [Aspergillus nomiae NRRL 13137]KNG90606.1 putative polyketide synthase [Aspergillus nomiae NRRL 13137]